MVILAKHYIKGVVYIGLAGLFCSSIYTPTFDAILTGFYMVKNGECGFLVNRVWGFIGLENPVCAMNNKWMHSFLLAMNGNHEAVLVLSGYCSFLFFSPMLLIYSIDKFSCEMENRLKSCALYRPEHEIRVIQ
jgi:hypothetical protein